MRSSLSAVLHVRIFLLRGTMVDIDGLLLCPFQNHGGNILSRLTFGCKVESGPVPIVCAEIYICLGVELVDICQHWMFADMTK